MMADVVDSGADETARLERALERIARVRRRPAASSDSAVTAALATRLDALIADLRAALKKDGAD
jgi:hypothetical protein